MKLHDGKSAAPTWMGAICSIMLLLIVISYTYQKVDILINKKDVAILSSLYDSYFDSSDQFSSEQGFNLAVALQKDLDPSIARFIFRRYEWGYDSDGELYKNIFEIESHVCTREELGLSQGKTKSKFMPIHEKSRLTLYQYAEKFLCVEPEELTISGEYNSD